jgi:hypothetical protein
MNRIFFYPVHSVERRVNRLKAPNLTSHRTNHWIVSFFLYHANNPQQDYRPDQSGDKRTDETISGNT